MPVHLKTIIGALALSLGLAGHTNAGVLRIKVDVGSSVRIYVGGTGAATGTFHITDGGTCLFCIAGLRPDDDERLNGSIKYILGSEADERKIGTIYIIRELGGVEEHVTLRLKPNFPLEGTLTSLEPFDFPGFAGPDLLAIVDIADLLASGVILTDGQLLSALNGTVPESSFITFKDIAGIGDPLALDDAQQDQLPGYNGSVRVTAFGNASPIPEPPLLTLLGIGLLAAMPFSRRRQSRAAAPD
ncbi:hypothetical protein O4H66_02730 [Comamonadaceae bacterium G21597-S1]|nr:hypothetical protein [Comamonadaceae bacterium G21597-S1]